jgi:adenylosuccinate lyase
MDMMRDAISPLDGRYGDRLRPLSGYFAESALMRARCDVEARYVLALDETGLFPRLSPEERSRARQASESFGAADFDRIKAIEATTRHDVKACELFLRERLALANPNLVHFGLTSEDVNNLAYSRLLSAYSRERQLPALDQLLRRLTDLAGQWKASPFPARTHGQLASPTTAGKEVAVFISRLLRQRRKLASLRFSGKLNGATGNFSAMLAAFPDFDWLAFSRRFLESLELSANLVTTQIEDHDTWAEYFNLTRQVNNIVLDLDQDFWHYISFGYLREAARAGEVGSSTMPHKVNPIHFENSEGNLQIANALLGELSDKLCRSRMQRDLSDSTASRNIGVALAHSYLALCETLAGLERIGLDEARCRAELESSPELLAEPIQTILRTCGIENPYDQLKHLTRGRAITAADLERFVEGLAIDKAVRARLKSLRATEYVGAAQQICEQVIAEAQKELKG